MKIYGSEFLGGTLGAVLAGAAIVSLAMPVAKKVMRPVTKSAMRGAYMVADGFRQAGEELRREWNEVGENRDSSGTITNAWRSDDEQSMH